LAFYHDEQSPTCSGTSPNSFATPRSFSSSFLNLVKNVVQPARRRLQRAADSIGVQQDRAGPDSRGPLWQKSLIDVKLKKANWYPKLLKTCLVRVAWREGAIRCDLITPNTLDVAMSDFNCEVRFPGANIEGTD
jgi:hypothetical protein